MSKGIWKKSGDLIPWSGDGNLNGWILSVWNVWVPDSQPGCHSYFIKSCQCPSPGILSNQPRFQEEASNSYSFPILVLAQMRIKIKLCQKSFLLHTLSNMKAKEISCKISLKIGESPSMKIRRMWTLFGWLISKVTQPKPSCNMRQILDVGCCRWLLACKCAYFAVF